MAKMQWSLFLLILMGQCSFLTCHLYEYRFVDKSKTWKKAQEYCKKHHTDLATVSSMTDVKRLRDRTGCPQEAWIGLYYNKTNDISTWHWSLPGVEYNDSETCWSGGKPNNKGGYENCGVIRYDLKWHDFNCDPNKKFICYNETNQELHYINQEKTWLQAQHYCREYHTDLVSGQSQLVRLDRKKLGKDPTSTVDWWIGLFKYRWTWSDGKDFSFRYWDEEKLFDGKTKKCAITLSNGKSSFEECNKEKPFFCYDDKMILIKRKMNWEDALYFCQNKYSDLVSITNPDEQRWVQEKAKNASTPYVWLGLRYTCTLGFWFWVDSNAVKYQNWDSPQTTNDCNMSGAMAKGGAHKWFKKNDEEEKFNFICSKF